MDMNLWEGQRLERVSTGFMQINRSLNKALGTLEGATAMTHIKEIIKANIKNTAVQSRANWTAANRIDSLI